MFLRERYTVSFKATSGRFASFLKLFYYESVISFASYLIYNVSYNVEY